MNTYGSLMALGLTLFGLGTVPAVANTGDPEGPAISGAVPTAIAPHSGAAAQPDQPPGGTGLLSGLPPGGAGSTPPWGHVGEVTMGDPIGDPAGEPAAHPLPVPGAALLGFIGMAAVDTYRRRRA